jgi:hypothetical protein
VVHLRCAFEARERRASRVFGCADDHPVWSAAAEMGSSRTQAQSRRRFGYRRSHVLLRRKGRALNHMRMFRLSWEERVCAAAASAPSEPGTANQCLSVILRRRQPRRNAFIESFIGRATRPWIPSRRPPRLVLDRLHSEQGLTERTTPTAID